MRHFKHSEIRWVAGMCTGAVLLLFVAVFVSNGGVQQSVSQVAVGGGSQAAATALGDSQGVPPGYTGTTYTADTTCWVNWSYTSYSPMWGPLCPGIGSSGWGFSNAGQSDTFYAGIFSASAGGTGQSDYYSITYKMPTDSQTEQGPYMGPASYNPDSNEVSCRDYSPAPGYTYLGSVYTDYPTNADCYSYRDTAAAPGATYSNAMQTAGGGVSIAYGGSANLQWSCLPSRTVNGELKGGQGIFSSGGWGGRTIYQLSLSGGETSNIPGYGSAGVTGSISVSPTVSTTYTLNCGAYSPNMSITVNVTNACPSYIETPWNSTGLLLYSGSTRRITQQGHNNCVTNNTGSNYFIPAATAAELQTFFNVAASLGVSVY